jgi:predicted type IV restriction endonuclease
MPNEIIYLNKNLDDNMINTIKSLKTNNLYRISSINNLVIKNISNIIELNQTQYKNNTELYLIKKYLMNEFTHNNFLNYYAIVKFNNITNLISDKDDNMEKLTIYKNKISPVLNNIVNNLIFGI